MKYEMHFLSSKEDFTRLPPGSLGPSVFHEQGADLHCCLVAGEAVRAQASLWWSKVPACAGRTIGMVGHFASESAEAAARVLEAACRELAVRGCTLAVGPMDGSTWRNYRLLTERGSYPPFFLEPDNPDGWPGMWLAAGFSPLATYNSGLTENPGFRNPRLDAVRERLQDAGVSWRPIDPVAYERELERIYEVSTVAFQANYLYSPISQAEFLARYRPMKAIVRPDLVWIAEHGGNLVGFHFAVPDLLQARRGEPMDTIIVKSIARLPDRVYSGIGGVLMEACLQAGQDAGFRRAIVAMMHETNSSNRLLDLRNIRRYTLFGRDLANVPA